MSLILSVFLRYAAAVLFFATALSALTRMSSADAPQDQETDRVLKTVSAHYEKLGSWQASFSQETFSTGLGSGTFSKGQIHFMKPNLFRFDLTTGEQSLVVSDGRELWQLQFPRGRSKPAYVRHFKSVKELELHRYLLFLSGVKFQDSKEFSKFKSEFRAKGTITGDDVVLELRPLKSSEVVKMEIRMALKSPELRSVVIEDALSNTTTLRFERQFPLTNPRPKLFRPEIPKGSTVESL